MTLSSPWTQRPGEAHHRLHWGRFKGQILAVIGGEACFLFLGIYLNEITYFIAGAALVLVGYFFWVRRCRLRDLQINQDAVQLIGAGDYHQAARLLDKLCQHPNNGSTLAVFLTNRATTALCLGEFETALPIYHEVLRAERGVARGIFKLQGDLFRARCAGQSGDIDPGKAGGQIVGAEQIDGGASGGLHSVVFTQGRETLGTRQKQISTFAKT